MGEQVGAGGAAALPPWRVVVVEDNAVIRQQLREFLQGREFDARRLDVREISDFEEAFDLVSEQKVDLLILDVYRGEPAPGGEKVGLEVLASVKEAGFVPVVIYTALPETLGMVSSPFVRIVGKDVGGLGQLLVEVTELFRLRVPQMHRAIVFQVDQVVRDYMWRFVEGNWAQLEPLAGKPEFLRILLQRLAASLSREGIDRITENLFGTPDPPPADPESAHPAEYYIMPPVNPRNVMLGDIRVEPVEGGGNRHLVVCWPTCDMVSGGGRLPKVERILCAVPSLLAETPELTEWLADQGSQAKQKALAGLLSNNRSRKGFPPDRFHFLPGVLSVPDMVVDFQALEPRPLESVRDMTCLATVASPYAESLLVRFNRYVGRLGTRDLAIDVILGRLARH